MDKDLDKYFGFACCWTCDECLLDIGIRAYICRRHGLIMTGGTDFHGANSPKPLPLGTCTASSSEIERLLGL